MIRFVSALAMVSIVIASANQAEAAEKPRVVASIKPVHSLVAGVMGETGTPALIVDGAASPHNYRLKPSQAHDLEHADAVFWIGEGVETFLEKPIRTLGERAKVVSLVEAPGVSALPFREGGAFEAHDHEGHAHVEHEGHGDHEKHENDSHGTHEDHAHEPKKSEEDHERHTEDHEHGKEAHDHDHGSLDGHIWLDPENARAMVRAIADTLIEIDPSNRAAYATNAQAIDAKLVALTAELHERLHDVEARPFVVFHDAYQYFDRRFGLSIVGSVTVSPEVMPGAKHVREIQEKIERLGVVCVFSEPQFKPKLVDVVTDGTDVKSAVLDPLGAGLTNGPDLYFELVRDMGTAMHNCLSPSS